MSHPTPEEIYDNEFDEYATEDCQICNPDLLGMVIVCPDDMCRGGKVAGNLMTRVATASAQTAKGRAYKYASPS